MGTPLWTYKWTLNRLTSTKLQFLGVPERYLHISVCFMCHSCTIEWFRIIVYIRYKKWYVLNVEMFKKKPWCKTKNVHQLNHTYTTCSWIASKKIRCKSLVRRSPGAYKMPICARYFIPHMTEWDAHTHTWFAIQIVGLWAYNLAWNEMQCGVHVLIFIICKAARPRFVCP